MRAPGLPVHSRILNGLLRKCRILDRGTAAIQNILGTVIFSILPQMVDIGLACVYIAYKLEAWIGMHVANKLQFHSDWACCESFLLETVSKIKNFPRRIGVLIRTDLAVMLVQP